VPTPQELESLAGIQPAGELDRKRIWAAAQAHATLHDRAPGADDLRLAERLLDAAAGVVDEHVTAGGGRAVITFSDHGEEIDVAVEFVPDIEQVAEDQIAGTPAQLLAVELLEGLGGEPETD